MSTQAEPVQGESVDRIRDIIFGPKMRDYEQRFEAIARDMDRMQKELDRLVEQLAANDAAQNKSLQALRQELVRAHGESQAALKSEIDRVGSQLAEEQTTQKANLQNLRQELRKADADLRDELRQIAQRLTEQKPDRGALGDLFIELGNHVKTGGSLADLLKGIDQPG